MNERWEDSERQDGGGRFDVPADVPLPPEVRARLRARVTAGLAGPDRSPSRRVPLAVAASVVLLAAGGALVTQSLGEHTAVTGNAETVQRVADAAQQTEALDRCWSAIVRAGKTAQVPARADWRPITDRPVLDNQTDVGVSAAGKLFFCTTTLTTVTVSDPNATPSYVGGSRTGVLLVTSDGVVAGVMDPRWASMALTSVAPSGGSGVDPVTSQGGLFIDVTSTKGDTITVRQLNPGEKTEPDIRVGQESTPPSGSHPGTGESHAELALPHPPAPLVSAVDRPAGPVDRTSTNGVLLGQCIARTDTTVVDPQSWQPGAVLHVGGSTILMAHNADAAAACAIIPQAGSPTSYTFSQQPQPYSRNMKDPLTFFEDIPPTGVGSEGPLTLVVGAVGDNVAKLQLLFSDGSTTDATPVNSTFVLAATKPAAGGEPVATAQYLRGFDSHGRQLFQQVDQVG